MNSPQDLFADAVRRGQETVNATVRTWNDSVQKLVSGLSLNTAVPSIEELVDRSYSFGVQVLAMQRDFTKQLLSYATPLTETFSSAVKTAADDAEKATERTTARVTELATKAADTTAAQASDVAAKASDVTARASDIAAKAAETTKPETPKSTRSASTRSSTTRH